MKGFIIIFLYFLGIIATILFGIWLISLVLFVFGFDGFPGEIVFLPKWIFLFSFLILLKKTKIIRKLVDELADKFEKTSDFLNKKTKNYLDNFFD